MTATPVQVVRDNVRELLSKGLTGQVVDLLIAQGHSWHVTVGALTTPIVGGGNGTTIAIDQPEGMIGCGAGTALIPVRIKAECEVGLIANDSEIDEIVFAVDTGNAPDGVDETTVTNEKLHNSRPDLGSSFGADGLTAWSAVTTALTTAPTWDIELDRAQNFRDVNGTPANALGTKFDLLYEPKHPPVLVPGADGLMLLVHWGGTVAVSGFAQIHVVAFPSAWVKGAALDTDGK